ncbi:hypothetical protein ACHAO5_001660 [Verticillium nonalfalfae]
MAILKSFRVISPAPATPSHDIIYISDDSDGDDNDTGHSSDECEFEDVFCRSVDGDDDERADNKEFRDAEIKNEEGAGNDDANTGPQQSGIPFSPGNSDDCGTRNEFDDNDTVLFDEPSDGEVVDRNLYDIHEETDDEVTPHGASMDDEASNIDLNNNFEVHEAVETIKVSADDRKDVIAEIAALREQLTRLEARIDPSTEGLPHTSPSGKRKRVTAKVSRSKKPKNSHLVNISASRACLQSDDGLESWVYSWQRGRGGRCWVRDEGAGRRDEADGEYLLCFASDMSIDVRVNADWLPITMRFNARKDVFEGFESIGGRRLEVKDTVMMQLLCGGRGEHFGVIS